MPGYTMINKGEVYEQHLFDKKSPVFKQKNFTAQVKRFFTDLMNQPLRDDQKLQVFPKNSPYLVTKKNGKNNPKADEIRRTNDIRRRWNVQVDHALKRGAPPESLLTVKSELIAKPVAESIKQSGGKKDHDKYDSIKVNIIALAGAVIMIVILVISSTSELRPVSREAAKELDGRTIDGQLIEELKPTMRYENGTTTVEINADYEEYAPIMDVITSVTGYDSDLTQFTEEKFYHLREQELSQRIEKQRLSEAEKEFWYTKEAQVPKPFVYHYHSGPANILKSFQALGFFILLLSAVGLSGVYARETADNMNQLLLCSR